MAVTEHPIIDTTDMPSVHADLQIWLTADRSLDDTRLSHVWIDESDKPRCTVELAAAGTLFTAPRQLRRFAERLLELADEACRREDELTDRPQADINRAGIAESRAALNGGYQTRAEHDEAAGRDRQLQAEDAF